MAFVRASIPVYSILPPIRKTNDNTSHLLSPSLLLPPLPPRILILYTRVIKMILLAIETTVEDIETLRYQHAIPLFNDHSCPKPL